MHSWGKKGNLGAKELLAGSTQQKCERSQWKPNSTSIVWIQQCGSFRYLRVLAFAFFLSCILSFVNHLTIFWLAAEVNLCTTILDYFITENYLITGYVLSLPVSVLGDHSEKLARLKETWRKYVGKCKGRMKLSCQCSFEECECINSFLLNTKLRHDRDVRINGCTQCFRRLWVVETRLHFDIL